MSWPEYVWRPQDPNADDMGMVAFTPPANAQVAYGADEGLPDDWQDYDGTVERVSAWDVLSNPLYEAAAGALDIDWEEFKNNFNENIGEEDDYERPEDEAGMSPNSGTQAEIDRAEDELDGDEDEPYDWGITDEGIEGDLNSMQGWLLETIGAADEQQGYSGSGPSADQYANIDGDIWAHFGLDKPPEKPKTLGDEYFTYKDSPSNYDVAISAQHGGHDNPWIEAGVWLGNNHNYAETYPHRGEKGATHVDWEHQRAKGSLTVPEPKGSGPAHDWYLADRGRNMPGNDLNPDVPGSGGNKLGQGAWGNYGTTPPGTETTTTEK